MNIDLAKFSKDKTNVYFSNHIKTTQMGQDKGRSHAIYETKEYNIVPFLEFTLNVDLIPS